jgi:SH3-like domain-containing protein
MRRLSLFAASLPGAFRPGDCPDARVRNSDRIFGPCAERPKGPSGLPLPRFVSLKASGSTCGSARGGTTRWPGSTPAPGVPMEVIQEYDNWRRVRDAEGTEGWVYQSLLSGERTAMTAPWKKGEARMTSSTCTAKPAANAGCDCTARARRGGVGKGLQRRLVRGGSRRNQRLAIVQSEIWGAYPGEAFK